MLECHLKIPTGDVPFFSRFIVRPIQFKTQDPGRADPWPKCRRTVTYQLNIYCFVTEKVCLYDLSSQEDTHILPYNFTSDYKIQEESYVRHMDATTNKVT